MATERTEREGHWDAFVRYAGEEGISLEHPDDWRQWWDCWNAALDARDNSELPYGFEVVP